MSTTDGGRKMRQIAPQYDNRGNPVWRSRMSAPDDTMGQCFMVPDRVIPVIFVPGVMGSNLKGVGKAAGTDWRLDSDSSMKGWLGRGARARKRTLIPERMEVDTGGELPPGTEQTDEELRRRGWGEVGAMSYQSFLVWLEAALSDYNNTDKGERVRLMKESLGAAVGEELLTHDEVGLSYRYRFPVHACGYNWLDSNQVSARCLGRRIDEVIARYRAEKKRCEKVIVVTHSMGGLVARHCSEVLGYSNKIFGIVHGVMPAIGAAAVYRRFKAGTEGPYLTSKVLGEDASEMTAVLSSAPGPLQLLPSAEYGNGWLTIKDGKTEHSLPKSGDPYTDIYTVRGKWWSMCDDQLINPLNEECEPKGRQAQVDRDWAAFENTVKTKVKSFHEEIAGAYHPTTHAFIGNSELNRAYGTVTWSGNGGGWLRGDRKADVLNAKHLDPKELDEERTVAATLQATGWARAERQIFQISEPDENGDGTVPKRSGLSARSHCASFLEVVVGHEPAYKLEKSTDNLKACRFTLRAIVRIAQKVQTTSLKYD